MVPNERSQTQKTPCSMTSLTKILGEPELQRQKTGQITGWQVSEETLEVRVQVNFLG